MAASHRPDSDRVLAKVRQVLTAAGFDEAMTASVVPERWSAVVQPVDRPAAAGAPRRCWKGRPAAAQPRAEPARRAADQRIAEQPDIELFETAKIYLPRPGMLPDEQPMLAIASGRGFLAVKGAIEGVVAALNPDATVEVRPTRQALLDEDRSCELLIGGKGCGFLGDVSREGTFAVRSSRAGDRGGGQSVGAGGDRSIDPEARAAVAVSGDRPRSEPGRR